jgi:hypothetical protein
VATEVATGKTVHRPIPSPARAAQTGPRTWTRSPLVGRGTSAEAPRLRQLVGVCGWAALLGGVGLIIGIRALVGVLTSSGAGWYEPSIAVVGLVGIGLTVAAFVTIQRQRLPYLLLGGATAVLVVGLALTANAF